jgi:hypothetical protein
MIIVTMVSVEFISPTGRASMKKSLDGTLYLLVKRYKNLSRQLRPRGNIIETRLIKSSKG